ncbi:hypothetical protein MTR67_039931 [Solanum verrucosum]|uniref:Uncharacterized protein n=1 Tax=Solanum verrucosum TaxID=315347 RepID=A0AAF0ZPC2_SOLVR|nr:hypothetical protein MTR67_039931 [Solanum verrucosum]
MIFNSSYQTVDLEIEVTEEEYREWYIPRALRSFFCYSPAALGIPVLAFLDLPSLKLACFERGETVLLVDFQLIASTYRLSAKSLSGSSYYIPSLLSISTVDAIEALNAISGGEDIPAATIGVDDTSSVRVRALVGITSANYLTVGGETTVRNVHVEAPLSSAAVREGSLSLVHQKSSSTKAARSVLVSPKRRKEGLERHREDSRTRHDSDPGKFDLHWPCCPQIDYSPLKVKPI